MDRRPFWKGWAWNWRWTKDAFRTRPLVDWLRDIPDPRCSRSKPHELAEIFVCIIMGLLAGKTRLRRIVRWCKRHLADLRRHMPFPHGIPSVSTMSRMLAAVDEDMVALSIMNWIGEISNTRGIHIAIDGKGLRAAAHKIRDERTPYILNAIDVASKLVVAQMAIREKTNEMTAIPELAELIEMEGSLVTVDAIGTTERIMDVICDRGGDFVLQVKKNCPALYDELMRLFDGFENEQKADEEEFQQKHGSCYSEARTTEKNRERYEYRKCQAYNDTDGLKPFQEERPHVVCVGRSNQVRILQVQDASGNDVTPSLETFLKEGSSKQPKPTTGDGVEDDIQRTGLISSRVLDAKELMECKRQHWAVENSLHYVLDETFGEDKSTIRAGKNTMSVLRKCAYNIVRLLQMEDSEKREFVPDVIDDICDDLEIGLKMIFSPLASLY